jgi:DNA invertase Pin-like site-specific DNA recombinase
LATLRKTNQPHEMGTVSEIAIKYGISKSEVRRMKANGTLESLALLGEV